MKLLVERSIPGIGVCEITLEVYEEDGRIIGAVYQVDGRVALPPKAWLATMRAELLIIENVAREAGCVELRMAGRFTKRMFPDYEPYEPLSGLPGLRKAL